MIRGIQVEIIVRDENWVKLCTFKVSQSDLKLQNKIGNILREKYGIDFSPDTMFDF